MIGIYRQNHEESPGPILLGDYQLRIGYEARLPQRHPPVGGLVIQTGPQEFIVAGYGFGCQFQGQTSRTQHSHIQSVEWGRLDDVGKWVHELWLNGDETGANNVVRIPPSTVNEYLGVDRPMILRVRLYRHD